MINGNKHKTNLFHLRELLVFIVSLVKSLGLYIWYFVQICADTVIAFLTSSVDVDCMSQAFSLSFTNNTLSLLSSAVAENNRAFSVTKEETEKEGK